MIIGRAPFRISFFGGGTDYPVWYNEHGGAVLATSINKYCYLTARYLPPFFNYKYRIRYTEREETQTIAEIKHPSVRECLTFLGLERGLEIQHNSDLPARIGLGSSSTFTVCLLHVLYALKGKMVGKRQLAIEVQPVTLDDAKLRLFHDHLMLFFTGFARTASEIAGEQIKETRNKKSELARLHEMVDEAIDILNGNRLDFTDFGRLLHEGWTIKRSLTNKITNPEINDIYETARKAGTLGGKLLGAGGGGCILLFAAPERQAKTREALNKLLYIPFQFENLGSQIIYYAPQVDF